MSQEVIPIRVGEITLLSKHLVLIKHNFGESIRLQDVEEQIECTRKLAKDNDYVVILDGGEVLDIEDDAMNLAARHVDDQWKAFALIIRSLSDRLFANYYLFFKKPVRPTQAFTTLPGAEKWLKQYVPIDGTIDYNL